MRLNKVTLISIDCVNQGSAILALRNSMDQCEFASVKFLTNIQLDLKGIEVVQIPPIKSKDEYSEFCIKRLSKYFDTEFVMVVQHDGYIISGTAWVDEFMDYDYIAPPWLYVDGKNVGCGGASLRSKKLQDALMNDDFINASSPEDQAIGRLYRDYLEKNHDIKFAPEELADKFGFELKTPTQNTFCFHGYFHEKYKPVVVIKRDGAFGDIISLEPVLHHFYLKGYRVVLDIPITARGAFHYHYFPIDFIDQIDQRLLTNATFYNLNMSYESKPKQLHLKTYYEFCNVPEYEMVIRNPKLSLGFDISNHNMRLIKNKYVLLHVDEREQKSRNLYGIVWQNVAFYLKEKGYEVYQVGKDDFREIIGVSKINTINEHLLSYVVAGASLLISIDSGISHVASGFDIPNIVLSGSVNLNYIHPDMSKKIWIHNHNEKVCEVPFCWHESITTTGQDCYIDNKQPPCVQFKTIQVLNAIDKILQ